MISSPLAPLLTLLRKIFKTLGVKIEPPSPLKKIPSHLCYKNYQKNLRDVSDDTKIFVSLNAKCLGGIVKKYKNENRQLPQKLVARKDLKRAIKHREMTAYYLIKRG